MPEVMEMAEAADEPICEWCEKVIAPGTGCYRIDRWFCEIGCWLDWKDFYED